MQKIFNAAIIFALVLAISSCASLAGDNTREVQVSSKPAGAAIYIDNKKYGTTPATITLPKHIYGGKQITLKKKGYQPLTQTVKTKFQAIALLDVLCPSTFFIDASTGDIVKIDPKSRKLDYQLLKA